MDIRISTTRSRSKSNEITYTALYVSPNHKFQTPSSKNFWQNHKQFSPAAITVPRLQIYEYKAVKVYKSGAIYIPLEAHAYKETAPHTRAPRYYLRLYLGQCVSRLIKPGNLELIDLFYISHKMPNVFSL